MSVKYWNSSAGFFRLARNWSSAAAPAVGDELYTVSGRITLVGGTFGSMDIRTTLGLIGDTAADGPLLTLRNVTLRNVAITEAPPLYTGPFDQVPPGYYAPRHGTIRIAGTVTNDGGLIEAGRNDRVGGSSLDVAIGRHATLINKGVLESLAGNRLTVSGDAGSRLENDAVIGAYGGPVKISTYLTGVGDVYVANAGHGLSSSVELDAAVEAGQTFHIQRGLLQLDKPLRFKGQLDIDAQGGGTVALKGLNAASWDAKGSLVELFDVSGRQVDTLRFTTPQDATTLTVYLVPDAEYGIGVGIINSQPFSPPTDATILPYRPDPGA